MDGTLAINAAPTNISLGTLNKKINSLSMTMEKIQSGLEKSGLDKLKSNFDKINLMKNGFDFSKFTLNSVQTGTNVLKNVKQKGVKYAVSNTNFEKSAMNIKDNVGNLLSKTKVNNLGAAEKEAAGIKKITA